MASNTTIIAEITRLDLQNLSTPTVASIADVKHLSSYSWIEAPTPSLNKDSGLIFIAQNAARHPDSPLEPPFRALYVANPSFDIRSIDVVTDRNNIRKLLSFINPGSSRDGLKMFTINIEVTQTTAIFCRNDTRTHEFIRPNEFKGFGHEFEKAYTTSQISGTTGHHRIISYRFGDLNFIVRHEIDGYVDANITVPSSYSNELENNSLSSMLGSLSLSPIDNPPNTISARSKLTIKEEGQVVPLKSTLEIKTRIFYKRLRIQDIVSQLWVSQTPKLVRAYHREGTFQEPEVEDITVEIKRWEENNQNHLRKLAALINKLLTVVKGCGGSVIVKYDDKGDKLVVWKVDGKRMLPMDLYSNWDDKGNSDAEADTDHDAELESAVKPTDGVGTKADGKSIVFGPEDAKAKHKSAKTCQKS